MKILKPLKFFIFCSFIVVLLVITASAASNDISPAIGFLRNTTTLDKCSVEGKTVNFTQNDFTDTIGTKFEYIVVNTLPEGGVLTLNGIQVISGQTIPVSSLEYLKFIPGTSAKKTCTFNFSTRANGWEDTEVPCVINILENTNFSPVASDVSLSTLQDVSVYGNLTVVEPDNDNISYKIVKFPRNGYARIRADGSIVYTPEAGYTGTDSLVYTASDKYGNISKEANVEIKVLKNESGIIFEDLKKSDNHLAAIKMAQKNIMTYSYDNGVYAFNPEKQVTKVDYLVMLMCAAKLDENLTAVADTDFLDDNKLSAGRKGYLAKALELGIVNLGKGIFNPLDTITKAEAAVMTAKALSLPELTARQTFVDVKEVPQWASSAVASSTNLGIFVSEKGYFSPKKQLTRGEVAVVLSNVLDYMETNKINPIDNLK